MREFSHISLCSHLFAIKKYCERMRKYRKNTKIELSCSNNNEHLVCPRAPINQKKLANNLSNQTNNLFLCISCISMSKINFPWCSCDICGFQILIIFRVGLQIRRNGNLFDINRCQTTMNGARILGERVLTLLDIQVCQAT